MPRYLYRYISFESFVSMIQKQALTFVLPEIWEDPTDKKVFDNVISLLDDDFMKIMLDIYKQRTFCQCWTTLYKSDAMWRIYSFHNRSIRIKAKESDLVKLDPNILLCKVHYTNEALTFQHGSSDELGKDVGKLLLDALCRKRKAFSHEHEYRLIHALPCPETGYTMQDYLTAYFSCSGNTTAAEYLATNLEHSVDIHNKNELMRLLYIGEYKKNSIDISYEGKNIIKGVMVTPFAPDWFVDTVKQFCENNNIDFEGKSALYDI